MREEERECRRNKKKRGMKGKTKEYRGHVCERKKGERKGKKKEKEGRERGKEGGERKRQTFGEVDSCPSC